MRMRRMMSKVVLTIIALSVFSGTTAGWGEDAQEIHIGGRVMCQDCTKGWNDWAQGGTPIKGNPPIPSACAKSIIHLKGLNL